MKHIRQIFSILLFAIVSLNASADDFNTVLKQEQQYASDTLQPLLSVVMPRTGGGCGWSIDDYVRNCARATVSETSAQSQAQTVKS